MNCNFFQISVCIMPACICYFFPEFYLIIVGSIDTECPHSWCLPVMHRLGAFGGSRATNSDGEMMGLKRMFKCCALTTGCPSALPRLR